MIKLRADLEKLEKCADEIALGGTNMDSQQLMRDARRDIGLLEREVRELESWRNAFAGAVFELIEPNLNQLLLERPSRVDVMTMRSVVHDMVTDGTILGNCAEVTLVNGGD
jgi:hypothetical protein